MSWLIIINRSTALILLAFHLIISEDVTALQFIRRKSVKLDELLDKINIKSKYNIHITQSDLLDFKVLNFEEKYANLYLEKDWARTIIK